MGGGLNGFFNLMTNEFIKLIGGNSCNRSIGRQVRVQKKSLKFSKLNFYLLVKGQIYILLVHVFQIGFRFYELATSLFELHLLME